MVAITYGAARVPAATAHAATKVPDKPWFARLMNALVESRMRQARREIALHLGTLPYTFDESGNRLVRTKSYDMPFGGW